MNQAFTGLDPNLIPKGASFYRGKVRDVIDWGTHIILTATDRISAFDRVLGAVSGKGEILHQLSSWWMEKTSDIVPNALVKNLGPRSVVMKKAKTLPVEIIVRGYLAGSALRDYAQAQNLYGIPPGLRAYEKLPRPYLTPSTKAEVGHDEPVSEQQILSMKTVKPEIWEKVKEASVKLFTFATEVLAKKGLILVDTKYEMGLIDGELHLIDEIHTPDSSRFWYSDSYQNAFEAGSSPKQLDKEVLRSWLLEKCWKGEGEPPAIPSYVLDLVRERYLEAWDACIGVPFIASTKSPEEVSQTVLSWRPAEI